MMSDWVATYDGVAAANGGLDLEMPTGAFMNRENLLPAIKDGKVKRGNHRREGPPHSAHGGRFGWLDRDQTDLSISAYNPETNAVALQAAREGMVLLKNDGNMLPLDKAQIKTILVVGPNAYPGVPVGGGSAGVRPFHTVSMLEGIGNYLGAGVTVLYERGLPTISDIAAATAFTTSCRQRADKPGLKMENFENLDLSGAPANTSTVHTINNAGTSWETLAEDPANLRWLSSPPARSTDVTPLDRLLHRSPSRQLHRALQGSGEGSGNRVYLDDKLVIDDWKIVRAMQPHVTVQLSAGAHKVVVEDRRAPPSAVRAALRHHRRRANRQRQGQRARRQS